MKKPSIPVVIVAGMSRKNLVIGNNNQLLWHVPEDLKRFKRLTLGHPIIMGQKTFDSILEILGKPFPGRTNIVVTRDLDYKNDGAIITHSLDEAFAEAEKENPTEIHIGGGGEIYKQTLPYVDRLHLTFYDDEKEGDTFFPDFSQDFIEVKKYPPQEHEGLKYQWVDFERK